MGDTPPTPAAPDAPAAPDGLAERLEQLERQVGARAERNRRLWRAVSVVVGLLAVWGIAKGLLGLIRQLQFPAMLASSPAFIGGVDEATTIFISDVALQPVATVLTVAAAAAAALGIYHTRRR